MKSNLNAPGWDWPAAGTSRLHESVGMGVVGALSAMFLWGAPSVWAVRAAAWFLTKGRAWCPPFHGNEILPSKEQATLVSYKDS